jgi:hypothetical protein
MPQLMLNGVRIDDEIGFASILVNGKRFGAGSFLG